jgi:hypothetical protein
MATLLAAIRVDDLVVLGLDWRGLEARSPAPGTAQPALLVPTQADAQLVVSLPPQHLGEACFGLTENQDPEALPPALVPPSPLDPLGLVESRIASPCRLVFSVPPDHVGIQLTVQGVLESVAELEPVFGALGQAPSERESRLELPWRLLLTPSEGVWAHLDHPFGGGSGRPELWTTRLAPAGANASGVGGGESPVGISLAQASPGIADPFENPPLSESPLSAHQRALIASQSVVDGKPAIAARQLMVSALGGWLDATGSWESGELAEWQHRAAMGRDYHVLVSVRGALFPLGHPALYVEVSDRHCHLGASGSPAILRKRRFIIVTEPVRQYAAGELADADGARYERAFPFSRVEIVTTVTPLLDAPEPLGVGFDLPPWFEAPYWIPAETAFWPEAGGNQVRFAARGRDRAGRELEFAPPLIFIADADLASEIGPGLGPALREPRLIDAVRGAYEDGSGPLELGGQPLAFTAPLSAEEARDRFHDDDPRAGTFEVTGARLSAGVADLPGDRVGFHPRLLELSVIVPSVRRLLGGSPPLAAHLAPEFLRASDNPGELVLELDAPLPLSFSAQGDRSGGLVAPSFNATALSSRHGPVNRVGLLGGKPADFFAGSDATLLGVIELAKVIASLDPATAPKLVSTDTATAGGTNQPPGFSYTFSAPLTESGVFKPEGDSHLDLIVKAPPTAGAGAGLDIDCTLSGFRLELFPGHDLFHLHFAQARFHSPPAGKVEVAVDLREVEFRGVLSFVEGMRSLIPLKGFGDGQIDVSAAGVSSRYSTALPALSFGIFSLENIVLSGGFTVPFQGDPVGCSFGFSSRERPFLLTVSGFGGGGYLALVVDVGGVRQLEAGFEFGASLSMDFGVASGGVHILGGFVFALVGEAGTLTGYLRMGGNVEVLGLVSVALELALTLIYEFTSGKMVGRAKLVLEVDIGLFSESVELECERRFGGSNGDPPLAEIMGPSEDGRDFPWREYAHAFVEEPRP